MTTIFNSNTYQPLWEFRILTIPKSVDITTCIEDELCKYDIIKQVFYTPESAQMYLETYHKKEDNECECYYYIQQAIVQAKWKTYKKIESFS